MKPPISFSSNADVIARRVAAWSGNVGPALAKATLECATVLTAAGKREAPVKTGRLRRSVHYVAGGQARYIVSPNTSYAAAVHEGIKNPVRIRPTTKRALYWKGAAHPWASVMQKKRAGNPFMTRARERSEPQIRQIAARAGATIVVKQG